jgi:ribosome biogenesis GTPase
MNGIVIKSTGSWYVVRAATGETVRCRMKGKLRAEGLKTTNPVAVGDVVELEPAAGGEGLITRVHERVNHIIRKSTNLSREAHVIAANVDLAVIVATTRHPATSTVFMDRFLAATAAYAIPAAIVLNKIDLLDEEDRALAGALAAIYRGVGYPFLEASAATGEGIDAVRGLLAGKVTALAGLSGAGKSTLINRLEPGLSLKTAAISEAHDTGRHTTTFAEMHPLTGGGFVIDTPGIRAFGLTRVEEGKISHYFPEIFRASSGCRFRDCTHLHEPGCAVLEAVERGTISESRYASYASILAGEHDKYRKGHE